MAESVMVMVVMLISGLGLSGASATEVTQSLQGAGYNFSAEQINDIYVCANDPGVIAYINDNSAALNAAYSHAAVSGSESGLYAAAESLIDSGQISKINDALPQNPLYSPTTIGAINGAVSDYLSDYSVLSVSYPSAAPTGEFADGHGGKFYYTLTTDSDGKQTITYYHLDSLGNSHYIYRYSGLSDVTQVVFSVAATADPDVIDVYTGYNFVLWDGSICTTQRYTIPYEFPDLTPTEITPTISETFDLDSDGSLTASDGTKLYPVDGVYTLPDGTTITLNPDGTYTIGGQIYSPTYTGTNEDLLKEILERLREIEKTLTFETDTDTGEDAREAAEEVVEGYDGELSELMVPTGITSVFPFCLPFDFVRGVKLLSVEPVEPVFEYDIVFPMPAGFDDVDCTIVIDLTKFDKVAFVFRWCSTMAFVFGLIFVTTKIVKGAGA